ncbi:MAG: hypothetical protein K0R64_666 [Novosphingobium lindaniclasticum]|jgi:hypothetical protein|uniref:Uncharacterized protein n=1 Tax=Novosphingobium lindaniclasticum LE124 TaxID=1096930 RepID=T0HPM4_9SPHN|nr:hypothetical protein [Novosphingobium lindaniclasticum]EQB18296.1 hypothetical protein L284_05225 [Novosphingobium lindaniclasticum LE124]MDF2637682.1 hypothetical protein [Novosphingobium lindaniclasticum]
MVDILALAVSHGLLALAVWRLLLRADLDVETPRDGAAPVGEPARRVKPVRREMRWPGKGGGDA